MFKVFVSLIVPIFSWSAKPATLINTNPPPDYRFKVEVLAEGMPQPMELEVAPDGRIFFNEISGKLKIYRPQSASVVVAGELKVFTPQENGFLGFALDPGFATNQWIYLFYSPTNYTGARLSRFSMRGDLLDLASEKKVIEFPEQRRDCCHHAGSVEFGPDGNLFISTGDNTHPGGDSSGYAPIDERPDHEPFDAQKSSANTHDLRGKILRIRPVAAGGYTIPDGNLFPKDGRQGRPEIYVMGCRNPWRISVDSKTGILYWGDVGPDAGGDSTRGPRGYDEINQARKAGNFGWPYFVGNNFAYADYDFVSKTLGARFDPAAPTNQSPNNTGAKILPPAQPAFLYWPYGESKEFPVLGQGGRTACAGPVFHFKKPFRKTRGFPEHYDNCLLFYDWQRPFMKWARLDSDSRLVRIEPFNSGIIVVKEGQPSGRTGESFGIHRPVDSQFGSDGCLYLLDFGETWGANKDSRLLKISYEWGNVAPLAKASVAPAAGREPLTVQLSSAGSKDFEGEALKFEWRIHPEGKVVSRKPEAAIIFGKPGNYIAELRVTDPKQGESRSKVSFIVGNTPPRVQFIEPVEGDFFTPGQPVRFEVAVTDLEDGRSLDYEEFFGPRTFVNATWGRGKGEKDLSDPGLAAMKKSDCFNCHALEQKVVGPPLIEIANRYRGVAGAEEASVERVIRGSSGVWGEIPMLPHEGLNPEELRTVVRWIFALEAGKTDGSMVRGLSGDFTPPKDEKIRGAVLEAVFTDAGRAPAGSLSGKAKVTLRSRRLEAEEAEEKQGLKNLGQVVGGIDHGHYLRFSNVNLSQSSGVTFRVASGGQGGKIELRQASPEGAVLAEVEVAPTGGWEKWIELKAPILPLEKRGDVVVRFVNPGKGGLMNLDWLQFNP